jgi:hypothetical protein
MRWVPLLVAAAVLFVGVAATWVGPDSGWSDRCPAAAAQEGRSAEVNAALWPPGTKCVVTLAMGREISRSYVPWREWLLSLLAAAAAWGAAWVVVRRMRAPRGPADRGEWADPA